MYDVLTKISWKKGICHTSPQMAVGYIWKSEEQTIWYNISQAICTDIPYLLDFYLLENKKLAKLLEKYYITKNSIVIFWPFLSLNLIACSWNLLFCHLETGVGCIVRLALLKKAKLFFPPNQNIEDGKMRYSSTNP